MLPLPTSKIPSLANRLIKHRPGITSLIAVLVLSMFFFSAQAQRKNLKFAVLDINDGLSQNNVMCVLEDSRGFLWFGTRDGLNKYDGYKFTRYRYETQNPYSISNNFINAITEDDSGNIWVATNSGLNRYDRKTDRFFHYLHQATNNNSISGNRLLSLLKDH